ncbi:MAG: hypothetical protein K2X81_27960 [Candidatus Obscuribacterales bacterium]|nr:hypothetical protein [Candidatus Obscuribacterales bacterium]
MKSRFLVVLIPLLTQSPVYSQALMESTLGRGGMMGLGSGLAASLGQGKVVKRSAEAVMQAQQSAMAQTKALEQSLSVGLQLETKKQWEAAEKAYRNALVLIAHRDGPGSKKSVPVLQHLANITKAENKMSDAISFQKTILRFAEANANADKEAVFAAQQSLSSSYIEIKDYPSAATILRQAAENKSTTIEQRKSTLQVYGKVLHELHKEKEAKQVETALATTAQGVMPQLPAETPSKLNSSKTDSDSETSSNTETEKMDEEKTLADPNQTETSTGGTASLPGSGSTSAAKTPEPDSSNSSPATQALENQPAAQSIEKQSDGASATSAGTEKMNEATEGSSASETEPKLEKK